jgi:hypothetical protein
MASWSISPPPPTAWCCPSEPPNLDEQASILDHWSGALDALDALRALSAGIGLHCDELASESDTSQTPSTDQALSQLFWGAHVVGGEEQLLLAHRTGLFPKPRISGHVESRLGRLRSRVTRHAVGSGDDAGSHRRRWVQRHLPAIADIAEDHSVGEGSSGS